MDPRGNCPQKKKKIISGSCLGGVWGCYLGCQVAKAVEGLWEISQWSLRLITEHTDSSRREKSTQALEESGVATWYILSLKQEAKEPGRYLGGVSDGSLGRQCPPKEKNHLG